MAPGACPPAGQEGLRELFVTVLGLPYREIWAVDFEFTAGPGDLPGPVCMVARELGSGRLIRMWQDELPASPPFRVDKEVLFVAYLASAELGCFLELGWPLPARVLDLYVEFRAETNGLPLPEGRSLLGALSYHRIPGITSEEKRQSRTLVMRGGPWSDPERRAILDYCQTDVDPMGALLERMLPRIRATPQSLGQALLRGRYMAAVARMEHAGVPIDVPTLSRLREGWPDIKLGLIRAVDKDYGVFDGPVFKAGLFAAWLRDRGSSGRAQIPGASAWMRTRSRTWRGSTLGSPRSGSCGTRWASSGLRNSRPGRTGVTGPCLARSAHPQAGTPPARHGSSSGPSVWLRGLIKPKPGQAVAYVDWSSQEVAIAAALSSDGALLGAVSSGDPYLAFAVRAGLAPPGATKQSHGRIRDMCKTAVLGVNYGMGAQSLAIRTGLSVIEAEHLLRALAAAYPAYWEWAERVIDTGVLTGRLSTVFGWPVHVTGNTRPTSLRNFPMQSNGAEMLRLACCLATERGVSVCAPVHDALLVEAPASEIKDAVAETRAAMAQAAQAVLEGVEIGTDVAVVRSPKRYSDPRGEVMWARVNELLDRQGCKG
jgi:hypothetical protein